MTNICAQSGARPTLTPFSTISRKRDAEALADTRDLKRPRTQAFAECVVQRQASLEVPRGVAYKFSMTGPLRGIGPNFAPNQVISTDSACLNALRDTGALADAMVEVHSTVPGEHTWGKDGFEYRMLPDHFGRVLRALSSWNTDSAREISFSNRSRLREKLVPLMTQWGRLQGFGDNVVAIPVDAVLRDTGGNARFGAVPLAHIDFPNKPKATLQTFAAEWKPKVELALQQKLTDDAYANLAVTSINNIWMPTSELVSRDHLVMLSTASTQPGDAAIYTATRRNRQGFEAEVVRHRPEHKWSVYYGMPRLATVIFSTSGQPKGGKFPGTGEQSPGCGHSAWTAPNDFGVSRTSVECRFLFLDLGAQGVKDLQARWDDVRRTGKNFV